MLLIYSFSGLLLWLLWLCISFYRNYEKAKKIGLPIVLEPVNSLNIPWLTFNQLLKTLPFTSRLRDRLIRRPLPYSYIGWQFDQGYRIHQKHGPVFVLVSPAMLQIVIADPVAADDVLNRRKDFVKPAILYEGLNVFGPNVNSAEGEVWQRHRRITAPSFNERISASVWDEALLQARIMLESWKTSGTSGVTSTVDDSMALALNVLISCGFGEDVSAPSGQGLRLSSSYRIDVVTILKNFAFLMVLPMNMLKWSFMPDRLRLLGTACSNFKEIVKIMVQQEKIDSNHTRGTTLLANLVKASSDERRAKSGLGLNDSELLGNIFIFTLAGHETTATTISTALIYLTRFPEYQRWLREELTTVLSGKEVQNSDYNDTFHRLKRCLAIMLETLRVHGSIAMIPKTTNSQPQAINVQGRSYILPANTFICVNNHALQLNPSEWGNDAEQWRPERWIHSDKHGKEELIEPRKGSFLPWADGPRNCPGMKFSQVEFVAVIATLFERNSAHPVLRTESESIASVNKKLEVMLEDSEIANAACKIRNPGMVRLHWTT